MRALGTIPSIYLFEKAAAGDMIEEIDWRNSKSDIRSVAQASLIVDSFLM